MTATGPIDWKRAYEETCLELAKRNNELETQYEHNHRLNNDLRTLRRTSVRVDVLLRWIYTIDKKLRPIIGRPETAIANRMTAMLRDRSTTNTKGIDSTRRAEEGK